MKYLKCSSSHLNLTIPIQMTIRGTDRQAEFKTVLMYNVLYFVLC